MVTKVKKETAAPPRTKAKGKALKAKKAVLKGIHSHKREKKKKSTHCPPAAAQDTVAPEAAHVPSKECPSEKHA